MMKQKTYIIGVSAGAYLIVSLLGVVYMYMSIYNAGELLTSRVNIIAINDSEKKMVKDLEVSLAQTEAERSVIREFVLVEDQTSIFLTDIEQVARAQNVTLTTNTLEVAKPVKKVVSGTTTQPAVPAEVSLFDTLAISFSIEGEEENVKKMLQIFETLPYHSFVTLFSLRRESGGRAKADLSLNVTLLK